MQIVAPLVLLVVMEEVILAQVALMVEEVLEVALNESLLQMTAQFAKSLRSVRMVVSVAHS